MGFELVVIGASSGGLLALQVVLAGLPNDFELPVVAVQHRDRRSDDTLVMLLRRSCSLRIGEPEDKEPLVAGRVYIAPADYHLLVEDGFLALSTEAPVQHARPSIDVLFESAGDAYREGVIGVILTGGNRDGAQGVAAIRRRGGFTIAQDPATAAARCMPEAAIATGAVDKILSLAEIGPFLARSVLREVH